MAVCKKCKEKHPAPVEPHEVECEVCYRKFKTTLPNAVVCEECSELSDFCQICKESMEEY